MRVSDRMKFDCRDFQLLDAIHRLGTFAKAAEHLNRTPSAITQSVQKLEDLLGFSLFDRSGYRPTISSEGLLFLERGRQILKQRDRLEFDLQQIHHGWGSEFSIAYDDLISIDSLFLLIKRFQTIAPSVTIRLHREVLNGCWDALNHHRATLAIGASGEPPIGLPCAQKNLGSACFVFAVAPHHPLSAYKDPLIKDEIATHTCIVVSDTSEHLPARTSGIFQGQPILVVPTMDAKIQAQVQGLGVGYLPRHRVEHLLKKGDLIERSVDNLKSETYLKTAWRTDVKSPTLDWFLEQLDKEEILDHLLPKQSLEKKEVYV